MSNSLFISYALRLGNRYQFMFSFTIFVVVLNFCSCFSNWFIWTIVKSLKRNSPLDLGTEAMKEYSKFPRSLQLASHNRMLFWVFIRTPPPFGRRIHFWKKKSQYIINLANRLKRWPQGAILPGSNSTWRG